jgi:type VI secretion system protein ImpC
VLGVHSLDEHPQAGDWNMSDDSAAGKLWSALRGQPESKYLGMSIPRFLARLPYGSDSDSVETFGFEEFNGTPRHDDLVWSNACFIVALLFAQSFRAFEWDLSTRMFQDVEGMPAYIYQLDGETVFQPCAEVQLSQNAAEKLMEYGLMPLVSFKNTDRVRLLRFQSVTDPVSALKGRWS